MSEYPFLMKILTALLLISINASASIDGFNRTPAQKLPKRQFLEVIRLLREEFQPLAQANGRRLVFQTDYDDDWAQAFARRWETDQVVVYGGMAGLKGGSEDSLALILCHELGHLYGGQPFGDDVNKLALEGQADYWSTSVCFRKIVSKLTTRDGSMNVRTIEAAKVVTAFYADNINLPHPMLLSPDPTRVSVSLKTHPTPQCRLDTLMAGLKFESRPACWFAD
jgi:hypothetical protein